MSAPSAITTSSGSISTRSWRPLNEKVLRRGLGCALALLAAGCNLDKNFEDLGNQLFEPGVGYIDAPGQSIATGTYRHISMRAPDFDTRYVVAFKSDNLELIRFEENGKSCSVGKAAAYGSTIPSLDVETQTPKYEPLLPYLVSRDDSGRGQLGFTNFSCEKKSLRVDDVPLPRDILDGDSGMHLITVNGSGELLAIDPWKAALVSLGKSTSFFDVKGDRLWSVNAGQLVLRNSSLKEIGHAGTQVSEVAVSRGSGSSWAAYVDAGTLYLIDEDTFDKPLALAEDVCGIRQVGSSQEQVLSFFSPCSSRRLALYDNSTGNRFDYVDDVITTSVVARDGDGFDLDYWTGPSGRAESGQLWIAAAGKDPVKVADDVLIQPEYLFTSSAQVIADWNGDSGNYVTWQRGKTTRIATEVAEQNSLGLIANFADGSGDLLSVASDGHTEKLGSGVPLGATRGSAFIANSSGGVGDLMVLDWNSDTPKKVASGVTPRAFLFSVQLDTLLMFLSDLVESNETATLQIRLLDTGDQFSINSGVSEILEVGYPRAGILYSVTDAKKKPGIWFSGVH